MSCVPRRIFLFRAVAENARVKMFHSTGLNNVCDGWGYTRSLLKARGSANQFPVIPPTLSPLRFLDACLKILLGLAVRDFGCGQGGESETSPQRAVTDEATQVADKRSAAGPYSIFRQALS